MASGLYSLNDCWVVFKCRPRHRFALFQMRWFLVTLAKPNILFSFGKKLRLDQFLFETKTVCCYSCRSCVHVSVCDVDLAVCYYQFSQTPSMSFPAPSLHLLWWKVPSHQNADHCGTPMATTWLLPDQAFSQSPDWHIFVAAYFQTFFFP